jgi:hypothetical protein
VHMGAIESLGSRGAAQFEVVGREARIPAREVLA